MRSLIACLALGLVACCLSAHAAQGPESRLLHAVWLGPGCDQLMDTDEFHELVGGLIEQSGVRAAERTDRLEVECFGKLLATVPRVRAYVSARVTITRLVPYHGLQGRLLLDRETLGIDLDAASLAGLRKPIESALRKTLKAPLAAYRRKRHGEVVATPFPWPQRIPQICGAAQR